MLQYLSKKYIYLSYLQFVFNPVMLYLNYLFLIFEWSACKLAGQAKCSFHNKQAFFFS